AQPLAQRVHSGRDHAEILDDQRQRPELSLRGAKQLLARPAPPAPRLRGLHPLPHGPVRNEAAEVVDAREIEESERPAEALDPPAVSVPPHRAPVVERVPPELA